MQTQFSSLGRANRLIYLSGTEPVVMNNVYALAHSIGTSSGMRASCCNAWPRFHLCTHAQGIVKARYGQNQIPSCTPRQYRLTEENLLRNGDAMQNAIWWCAPVSSSLLDIMSWVHVYRYAQGIFWQKISRNQRWLMKDCSGHQSHMALRSYFGL